MQVENYSQGWWAYLSPDNFLWDVWPDGMVPISSPQAFIPREHGMPPCYEMDASRCSQSQLEILAANLYEKWKPECESVDQALAFIKGPGLPLQCTYFTGVMTSDLAALLELED